MEKIITHIEIKSINLDGINISNIRRSELEMDQYMDRVNLMKKSIIDALEECDDFSIEYSSSDYWGDSCELKTYKLKIESDEDFEKRKESVRIARKKSVETRKLNKENKERKEYERLKSKFESK